MGGVNLVLSSFSMYKIANFQVSDLLRRCFFQYDNIEIYPAEKVMVSTYKCLYNVAYWFDRTDVQMANGRGQHVLSSLPLLKIKLKHYCAADRPLD